MPQSVNSECEGLKTGRFSPCPSDACVRLLLIPFLLVFLLTTRMCPLSTAAGLNDSGDCIMRKCINPRGGIRQIIARFNVEAIIKRKDTYYAMCREYRSYNHCAENCGKSGYYNQISMGLAAPRFACDYAPQDFKRHLDSCFPHKHSAMLDLCVREKQRSFAALDKFRRQAFDSKTQTLRENWDARSNLTNFCTQITLYESCFRNAIDRQCGRASSNFFWEFQLYMHRALLLVIENLGMTHKWPPMCHFLSTATRYMQDHLYATSGHSNSLYSPMASVFLLLTGMVIYCANEI